MKLTPEERKKIYEEEKARIEAREQLEKEKRQASPSPETTINLSPEYHRRAVLPGHLGHRHCLLHPGTEKQVGTLPCRAVDSRLRILFVITSILHWIPFIGWIFTTIIWIFGFVLWIVLMSKAYNGERYKLPLAGDIAEMMVGITITFHRVRRLNLLPLRLHLPRLLRRPRTQKK